MSRILSRLYSERGFSLIEVVASLAIIILILLSFSQFFLQAKKTATYNNEKIVTINLADAVLAKIQSKTYSNISNGDLTVYFKDDLQTNPLLKNPPTKIKINDKVYKVSYNPSQNSLKPTNTFNSEKDLGLIKVIVTVASPDGSTKGSSEGYIVVK